MVSAKKEPRGGDPGASTETNSEHLPSTSGEESRPAYEVIAALAEAYPKCFVVYEKYRRPLKVGIHRDLIAALEIPEDEILNALRMYVANLRYLKKLRAGAVRIGLDGEPAGTVTKLEQADAERRIVLQQAKRAQRQADERKEPQAEQPDDPDGEWARKLHPANAAKPRLTLRRRP